MERIKLAKVLKDSKKTQKDRIADNDKENEQLIRQSILSQHIQSLEAVQIEEISSRPCKSPEIPRQNHFQKIRPKITKIANKRARTKSPENKNEDDLDIIILDNDNEKKDSSSIDITVDSSPAKKQNNTIFEQSTNIGITQKNNSPVVNNSLQASFILPTSNLANLFSRPVSIINPTFVRPINQNYSMMQQLQTLPQNMPVILPANFSGTVLIQPTIHIHTNSKNVNLDKFCKIKPKNVDISPAKTNKN